ncbi:MAG: hypothetical protein GY806_07530 [Gammaproteobacteria bacterium]|nr:hypothetical protein [Gammaproteobacteria bacterium]
MYSMQEIVTAAHLEQDQERQKRAGLLMVFGGSTFLWMTIISLILYIL